MKEKTENQPHAPRRGWLKNGNRQGNPDSAPRCGARTRRITFCKGPAMRNGRCRMHGGASTGPKTVMGLEHARRGNWKHGYYSANAIAERSHKRRFLLECKKVEEFINNHSPNNKPV